MRIEKGIKNVFEEIMAEKFPKLKKETDIQVQGAQRVPNKINTNGPTLRHIIIKMAKVKYKERILKRKRVTRETPIRLSADFSIETLQAENSSMLYSKS